MRKRDTAMLVGGTLTGMGIVLNGLALECIRENFFRRSPKTIKAGKIDSVDEMHLDYLRRKGKKWIESQRRESVEIMSRDGFALKGEYIHNTEAERADKDPVKVVVLSHGYGGTGYKDLLIFADFYGKQGFDILLLDQRAHGKSEGNAITFGAKEQEDMIRWVRTVVNKAGDNCEIILHGWSMGAAIVYLAAANGLPKQVKGIVYDCGYSAAEAQFLYAAKQGTHLPKTLLYYMVQCMKPWCKLVCGFDMRDSSPLFVTRDMRLPVFFVHGTADTVVPVWMGKKLYDETDKTPYRDLLLVEGADHTYSYLRGKGEYEEGILRLIDNCM